VAIQVLDRYDESMFDVLGDKVAVTAITPYSLCFV
jgi:hypothetical protein